MKNNKYAEPLFIEDLNLLTDVDMQRLIRLNATLLEIQKECCKKLNEERAKLELEKTNEKFDDCDAEVVIQYFSSILGDAVVFETTMGFCPDESIDWNDLRHIEHPVCKMEHCWLFHDMYDHLNLTFRAMSIIDYISWEIRTKKEYVVNLREDA